MAPIPERGPKGLVLACLLLSFFIINEISFRSILFTYSLEIIVELQSYLNQSIWEYIFEYVFACAGNPNVIGPIFLIYFIFQVNKYFSVKLLLYSSAGMYIFSLLELLYSNPRPYWIDTNIIPMEDHADYGNPSGHAFMTTFLYGYIYLIFSAEKEEVIKLKPKLLSRYELDTFVDQDSPTKIQDEKYEETKSFRFKITVFRITALIWFVGLLISRIYLGMHSINQVALGVVFGAFSCYLLTYFIDKRVDKFLIKIITKELSNKNLLIWSLGLLYAILSIIPIIVYISCDINNPINQSIIWTEYWLIVQTELKLPPSQFAYIRCLIECSLIGAFFGILFGILFTNGEFYDIKVPVSSLGKNLFLRVLLGILVFCFGAGFFSILPVQSAQYTLFYFLNQNLGLFFGSFLLIKALPLLYSKMNLDCHGDFLRVSKI